NWTCGINQTEPFQAYVKTRYTAAAARALVIPIIEHNQVKIHFDIPQRDITPGQAAVFYDGETVLGGGLITNSY
ncbi:MAG: aminomethyltransferase beta-barrel domain-containing protein, partial [Chloroflexota bacterium]